MYLTGFADEAGKGFAEQIKATKALGWENIEARNIDGTHMAALSDADFDAFCLALSDNGVKVNCFGSPIMNWASQITDPFEDTIALVKTSIERMKRLNIPMVRIMSYALLEGKGPEEQMEEERFRRVREIKAMLDDAGILPVHENCMNYGGMGSKYTLRLIENVPGLKLVFDTGNPVFTDDRNGDAPYKKQCAWDFYSDVKEHIAYIHIKDGTWDAANEKCNFTYAGDGDGDVKRIVTDALAGGYDGGISMEPHIGTVYHEADSGSDEEKMYQSYVEYGKRFMALLEEIKATA